MKGENIILKLGSIIFLSVLVIIIVFTFGVPNFLGLAQETNSLILGKINDEVVTRREVLQAYSNYQKREFEGEEIPQEYKKIVLDRVTEQVVVQKLLYQMYANNHLGITEKQSQTKLLEYLKNNFPNYVSEKTGRFLIKKFQRQILDPNNMTLQSLGEQNKKEFVLQNNQEFLNKISLVSNRDIYERILLINSNITVQVVRVTNKINEEKIRVSKKEIKKEFEKQYLSKDKDSKLTTTKKQDIIKQIQKRNSPSYKRDGMKKYRSMLVKINPFLLLLHKITQKPTPFVLVLCRAYRISNQNWNT